jgi:membrane protein YdbS with pleckstrin-like domain
VLWRGYDLRAAMPPAAVALLASVALLAGRWFVNDFADALVPYLIVLVLWPALLGVALYRAVTYTYHLTDAALLVDRGPLHLPIPPLWLNEIAEVKGQSTGLFRLLGIGSVRVTTVDGRVETLTAIRHPEEFARQVLARVNRDPVARSRPVG